MSEKPPSNIESESKKELPPDVLERVLRKIIDIDAPGTAYSIIGKGTTERILQEGLLGSTPFEKPTKKTWAEKVRSRKGPSPAVYINIVGRAADVIPGQVLDYGSRVQTEVTTITRSYHTGRSDSPTIVFDINGYQEIRPENLEEYDLGTHGDSWPAVLEYGKHPEIPAKRKTFRADDYGIGKPMYPRGIQKEPSTEYGFRLFNRIPRRLFKALVVHGTREIDKSPYYVRGSEKEVEDQVKSLVEIMTKQYFENGIEPIPIYDDYDGAMLWPKKIPRKDLLEITRETEPTDHEPEQEK